MWILYIIAIATLIIDIWYNLIDVGYTDFIKKDITNFNTGRIVITYILVFFLLIINT